MALLASAEVATLATVRPDGSPRLVPIVFARVGDRTLVSAVDSKPKTTLSLRRLADIERDPRVSVLAHHYESDWSRLWWVRADGIARVEVDPAPRYIDALVGRYPQYRHRTPEGPWIVIEVGSVRSWTAGTGGMDPIRRDR
jgi:PPOX class probable F420-dependent enzyme